MVGRKPSPVLDGVVDRGIRIVVKRLSQPQLVTVGIVVFCRGDLLLFGRPLGRWIFGHCDGLIQTPVLVVFCKRTDVSDENHPCQGKTDAWLRYPLSVATCIASGTLSQAWCIVFEQRAHFSHREYDKESWHRSSWNMLIL
jgi:hypothetical protein